MSLLEKLMICVDVLLPRYLTEWVVVEQDNNGDYFIAYSLSDLKDGDSPCFVMEVSCFNFLGKGYFVKPTTGDIIPYSAYRKRDNSQRFGL